MRFFLPQGLGVFLFFYFYAQTTCVKIQENAPEAIIHHLSIETITYLWLVEYHLFRWELGHRKEPAAAGESAGAQRAEDWGAKPCRGSSGYYMHGSGTRLFFLLSYTHHKKAPSSARWPFSKVRGWTAPARSSTSRQCMHYHLCAKSM